MGIDTPPTFTQENIEEDLRNEELVKKGKFSFLVGIVACGVSILLYILTLVAMASFSTIFNVIMMFWALALIAAGVLGLLAGIKGMKSTFKVKSIIGTAFGGQNAIVGLILLIMSIAGISIASTSHYYYHW